MTESSRKRREARWNEESAKTIARTHGIKNLDADHWLVISYLRDYYKDFQQPPSMHKICIFTGFNSLRIYRLFPEGGIRSAWVIAGLPH